MSLDCPRADRHCVDAAPDRGRPRPRAGARAGSRRRQGGRPRPGQGGRALRAARVRRDDRRHARPGRRQRRRDVTPRTSTRRGRRCRTPAGGHSSCARRRRSRTAARSRWPGSSHPCSTCAGWEAFLAAVDEVVRVGRRRPDRRARAALPPAVVGRRAVRCRPGDRPHRPPRRRRRARRSGPAGQRAGRRRPADAHRARPARRGGRRRPGRAAGPAHPSQARRPGPPHGADVRRSAGHRVGDRRQRHPRAAAEPPDHRRRRRGSGHRPGVRARARSPRRSACRCGRSRSTCGSTRCATASARRCGSPAPGRRASCAGRPPS